MASLRRRDLIRSKALVIAQDPFAARQNRRASKRRSAVDNGPRIDGPILSVACQIPDQGLRINRSDAAVWFPPQCPPQFPARIRSAAARELAIHVVRSGLRESSCRFQQHAPKSGLDGEPGYRTGGKGRRSGRFDRCHRTLAARFRPRQPGGPDGGSELSRVRAFRPSLEGMAAMMRRVAGRTPRSRPANSRERRKRRSRASGTA